jgi:hypothetical protein
LTGSSRYAALMVFYTGGSLSRKISHWTHPLVYECKQMCSNLLEDGVEDEIM